MKLSLYRDVVDSLSTEGKLFVDGAFNCFSLEPSATAANPRIPAGTYPISLRPSPKFKFLALRDSFWQPYCDAMPHIDWKPNSLTMIHVGNDPQDTLDCILVATGRARDQILHSRTAFAALYPLIQAAMPDVSIQIFDPPAAPPLTNAEDVDIALSGT